MGWNPTLPMMAMARLAPSMRLILWTAGIVFLLDRLTKWAVIDIIDLPRLGRMEVVDPFLNFVMAWNEGINFGLTFAPPEVMRWGLIVLAIGISAGLFWWAGRRAPQKGQRAVAFGAGIVIGGALGNAWDRLQYGAVADFLNMSCCGIANPYAFNIADVAIFAGAVLIAWKA
ncbi:MAG: signal peptidase II [Pseudomonadota bacterium]